MVSKVADFPASEKDQAPSKPDRSVCVHVLVCGAGPAGLLISHYLLLHGNGRFRVTVWDQHEDPREACKRPPSFHRGRWSITIEPRGRAALSRVPGLEAKALQQKSATILHSLMIYLGMRCIELTTPKESEGFNIDRLDLCKAMLEELMEHHGDSGLVEVKYGHCCTHVDLDSHTATFLQVRSEGKDSSKSGATHERQGTVPFDLIIGADGLHSAVRHAMASEPGRACDVCVRDATIAGSVVQVPIPEGFRKDAKHIAALSNVGGHMNCVAYTSSDTTLNMMLYYFEHDPPKEWVQILEQGDVNGVKKFLDERVSWLDVTADACHQFLRKRRQPRIKSVKSSTYHSARGRAVLIGDAAHCTYPFLGQGCNAAFVDAIVLGRLLCGEKVRADDRQGLQASFPISQGDGTDKPCQMEGDEFFGRLPGLLEVYSALQVPEGHALVDLSEVVAPLDSRMRVTEMVRERIRQMASAWLPWFFAAPMRTQATLSLLPYSGIRKTHQGLVERVLRSNEEVRQRAAEERRKQVLLAAGVD